MLFSSRIGLLVCLCASAHAYSLQEWFHDTSDGYCDVEGYGKIPVGGEVYSDEECEKIICNEGFISSHSCDLAPINLGNGCHFVPRQGRYPACCRPERMCRMDIISSH
ncbi:hypothetical protein AVEN_267290-1 [Araneus ventricosus]|uniref:Single domain-containing protein n=1 Tax=Araneus ventricosus TaxID=182803 RepID=A0A4Y2DJK0_ARAVE|nr:hypothetical protein AVEN_267290-1 [Araneus ventricosus]